MFQNYETGETVDIKNLVLISLKEIKEYKRGFEFAPFEVKEFIFGSNLGEVSICKPLLEKAEEQFVILDNQISLKVLEEAINYKSEIN